MPGSAEAELRAGTAKVTYQEEPAPGPDLRSSDRISAVGERRVPGGITAESDGTITAPVAGRGWSDGALVTAVLLRREDAFAELYRRHGASVTAVSSMILGSGPDSADVAAEVFATFWLAPHSFDPARGSLLSFLRMKARGRSIDVVRSTAARRRREVSDVAGDARMELVAGPDEMAVQSESADAMRRAVVDLPPGERDSIYLAFFEGMSYKAVAVRLGIPEGTVKSRIRSGLQRLRTSSGLDPQPVRQVVRDRDREGLPEVAVACRARPTA